MMLIKIVISEASERYSYQQVTLSRIGKLENQSDLSRTDRDAF